MKHISTQLSKLSFFFLLAGLIYWSAPAHSAPIRFQAIMRDAAGNNYALSIWAPNEKRKVEEAWGGAAEGDISVSGTYQAALRAKGQKKPVVQKTKLCEYDEMSFNLNRDMIYLLKGQAKNQPDVLVLEQHGGHEFVEGRLFFIDKGRLQPLKFTVGKESSLNWVWNYYYRIENDGKFRFRSSFDNKFDGKSDSTWLFEPQWKRVRRIRYAKAE